MREAIFKFSRSIRSFSSFLALKCKLFDRLCSLNCTVEWLLGNRFYIWWALNLILLLFQPVFQQVSSIVPSYLCRLILISLIFGLLPVWITLQEDLMYDLLIFVSSFLMIHFQHRRQCLQSHFWISVSYLLQPLFMSLEHTKKVLNNQWSYSSRSFIVTKLPLSTKLIFELLKIYFIKNYFLV